MEKFHESGCAEAAESAVRTAVLLHEGDVALWHKRADRMLVYHLLAALAVDNDGEVVKGTDDAADLKPVGQINSDRNAVFAKLIEKRILDVNGLVHWP
jgi:hypothetical protein